MKSLLNRNYRQTLVLTLILGTGGYARADDKPAAPALERAATAPEPVAPVQAPRAAVVEVGPAPVQVAANPVTAPDDVERSLSKAAQPPTKPTASEMINKCREDYLRDQGFQLGNSGNPGGAFIAWGEETVSVAMTDPAWAKARVFAYERALLLAEANYATFAQQHILSDKIRTLSNDDSQLDARLDLDRMNQKDKIKVLKEKALALAESELDARLRKAGVDPKEFQGRPKFEKVSTLADQIVILAFREAVTTLAGVRTLQTFEGVNEKGTYKIGVLIVESPRFKELANAISSGRVGHEADKDPRASILAQIPTDPNLLVNDLGIRVMIDENGQRCVVSFAQWAVGSATGSDRMHEMKLDRATETARTIADTAIADFANATLVYSEEGKRAENNEAFIRKFPKGVQDDVEAAEFLDASKKEFRLHSELTISGIADIHTWRGKHPKSGQEIVGVIRMWSPSLQQSAKSLNAPARVEGSNSGKAPVVPPGATQGNKYDKPNDF